MEPSFVRTITHGPELLTGGAFGPEGGILILVAELVGIVILLAGYQIAVGSKKQKNRTGGKE